MAKHSRDWRGGLSCGLVDTAGQAASGLLPQWRSFIMSTFAAFTTFSLLSTIAGMAFVDLGGNVLQSNGTAADTQAAINAAADGYTVRLPGGSFTWSTGIRISGKGIKLQGAGAGGLRGHSTS